jgi:hypothetical protein
VPIAKPPVPKPPEPVAKAPTAHSPDAHASASAPVGEAHDPAPPPIPSACQVRLTSDIAVTQPLRPITGPGSCGADDLVRLEAVVLKDGERIALAPAATLRCPMAEAVAHWVRDDVAPAATTLEPIHKVVESEESVVIPSLAPASLLRGAECGSPNIAVLPTATAYAIRVI